MCSAAGGAVGEESSNRWTTKYAYGGAGGSGGGGLQYSQFTGAGGSNGSNGGGVNKYGIEYGGKGQGTTTRAFGESSGTLYAGGGGAGYYGGSASSNGEPGGDGGGGAGSRTLDGVIRYGLPGTANTGGGAGGSSCNRKSEGGAGSYTRLNVPGGSGICLVRWGY